LRGNSNPCRAARAAEPGYGKLNVLWPRAQASMVRLPCDEPTDDSGRQVEQLVEPSIRNGVCSAALSTLAHALPRSSRR